MTHDRWTTIDGDFCVASVHPLRAKTVQLVQAALEAVVQSYVAYKNHERQFDIGLHCVTLQESVTLWN